MSHHKVIVCSYPNKFNTLIPSIERNNIEQVLRLRSIDPCYIRISKIVSICGASINNNDCLIRIILHCAEFIPMGMPTHPCNKFPLI